MAIDINNILADTFLSLCREKEYKDITVKDIRERSGISRTGFYNHFRDKNDLVQWIYYERIQTSFQKEKMSSVNNYYEALVFYYQKVQEYHFFLKSALKDNGQNCLRDYMYEHPYEWELQYHKNWYEENTGEEPEMEKLSFFTEYHSSGAVSMTIKWIQRDMPISPEEMARRISYLKRIGFGKILNDTEENFHHPYE